MYKFKLPIGDWSDDGHGKCDKYLIESNTDPVNLVDMYIHLDKKMKIGEFCAEYQDRNLTEDQVDMIKEMGLDPDKYVDESRYFHEGTRGMAKLILDSLMIENPSVKMKIVHENVIEFNNWFGQNVKKVTGVSVLDLPGYGMFD